MRFLFAGLRVRAHNIHSVLLFSIFSGLAFFAAITSQTVPFVTVIRYASAEEAPLDVADWIRAAQESKQLQVDFYEPNQRPTAYPGWTDFDLSLEYKYSHQTRWTPTKGERIAVTIQPTFTTIKPVVSHVVKLPVSVDALQWHESVLGRHELDHVAIGSHPRLIMLTTHLVKNIGILNRMVDRVSDVTRKWADESITEEVNNRRRAVQNLVTCNNDYLDFITRHGGKDITRREAFFDRLFLKENLDQSKFAYLGEVLELVRSDEYQNANLRFSH